MYSKEQTQKLKREFWITFAERYPRKWILHDTKIKDFSFKFYADNKKAKVSIDIEHKNEIKRIQYFEKFKSLEIILKEQFVKNLVFEKNYTLENGKIISRIWIEKLDISLGNKTYWNEIFNFFNINMSQLELFYSEYDEFIKDIE